MINALRTGRVAAETCVRHIKHRLSAMTRPEPNAIMQAPAIELPSGHIYKLVGSNWVAVSKDGSTVTVKTHPYAFWILLQYTLDRLASMADSACVDAGLAADQCLPLPVEDIIRGGLTAPSEEWQALALARAGEFSEKDAFVGEITELVKSGRTQAVRHRALKLRARLKREGVHQL